MADVPSFDRLKYKLDNWKRQLIDLTRRNRLLNYRPTRATTIEIVDEVPQQVLRQLLDGERFRFDPRPEPEAEAEITGAGDSRASGAGGTGADPDRFTVGRRLRYTQDGELAGRHRDDRLQTRLAADQLDRNLLAIYRRAKESIEEQGVNTLFLALGMLRWYEADSSDVASLAPLVMVPVALSRRSAASPFLLSSADEDPILNPAIVAKLRLDFQIELPELPEAVEDLDLDRHFRRIETAVRGLTRWELTADVALGLFSFQKFIMYRDLETHEGQLRQHSVIGSICREDDAQPGRTGLPPEVTEAPLDEEMSPWAAVQVLDADSSQQQAMLAVRKGCHLVIEGPPGTGKSQTITNLIADALHDGKTVLFVSEKMAALDVVKTRLEFGAGLGDHVLELHSNRTAKTAFVREIARTLDRPEPSPADDSTEMTRLRQLTKDLRAYVVALHQPEAPLGRSPYEAIGELIRVEAAPEVRADLPGLMRTDGPGLTAAQRKLSELARSLLQLGNPASHPLRGISIEHATPSDRRALEEALDEAGRALDALAEDIAAIAGELGLRPGATLGDAQVMVEGARVVARSPGTEPSVLRNDRWNELSSDAVEILGTGRHFSERRRTVEDRFRPEILDNDLTEPLAQFSEHLERGAWRFFIPSYWRIRKKLRSFLQPDAPPPDATGLLEEARTAQLCREDRLRLEQARAVGSELFGSRWDGPNSDWDNLQAFAEWVVDFRRFALGELLAERGFDTAAEAHFDRGEVEGRLDELSREVRQAREAVAKLVEAGKWKGDPEIQAHAGARIEALRRRVAEVRGNLDQLRPFSLYVAARNACRTGIVAPFTEAALSGGLAPNQLEAAFRRSFHAAWLERVFADRPVLGRFETGRHEGQIQEFQDLDRKSFQVARSRTQKSLGERRREILSPELGRELQLLQVEAKKQRRIMPIRKSLSRAGRAVQRIKPCFMMSPLSVAQYIDPDELEFDLLVFDEASQIPPSDAIGAIMRARQIVVVGDSKQLPPTNFFGAHLDDADMEEEDDELALLADLESILDQAALAGIPGMRLKWHYRSEHQSLIRFSNEEFYQDDPLLVFPSSDRDRPDLGLKFEHVRDGVYEGKGRNPIEARRVAKAVVEHIRTTPQRTLGVGTFGIAQQALIQDELDRERREDPAIEWFFQQDGEKKFFVKNLENIQGDDRDVIFLSVTYGPGHDGRVSRNFGPINKAGGWRRLNVLTTRAKRLLCVFSSMQDDQIDTRNVNRGAVLLRQYLHYARTGEYPSPKIPQGDPDSPFEEKVLQALRERGYSVVPQVGDAGYRVDIGVLDADSPGRYICAIECDGASYHSAATVRDRDRLRQQVLEARGWDIHRVWSTDWFHDSPAQLRRLVILVEESQDKARKRQARGEAEKLARKAEQEEERRHSRGENDGPNGGGAAPPAPSGPKPPRMTPPPSRPGGGGDTANQNSEPLEVPPYTFTPIQRLGSPEDFYQAPLSTLADVIRKVVNVEGPIHLEELSRRVAAFWGMQRAGKRIVARVEFGLRRPLSDGDFMQEGSFISLSGRRRVQVRCRDLEGVVFSTDEIPPSEVREAIRIVLAHRAPLLEKELVQETARVLGFKRTGDKLRQLIGTALHRLIESGRIRAGGIGLYLKDRGQGDPEGA
jgi:very-short-patch-repair endonuclease/DNA polymerase III delta prime subunit